MNVNLYFPNIWIIVRNFKSNGINVPVKRLFKMKVANCLILGNSLGMHLLLLPRSPSWIYPGNTEVNAKFLCSISNGFQTALHCTCFDNKWAYTIKYFVIMPNVANWKLLCNKQYLSFSFDTVFQIQIHRSS